MKRFAKGCLIIVVSLAIAGVVLLCVAAGGGVNRATLKRLSEQRALRFGPFYVYTDGPLSWHLGGRSWVYDEAEDIVAMEGADAEDDWGETGHHSADGSHTVTHYEFAPTDIRAVDIDMDGAKVKILSSENDKIQIDVKRYEDTDHNVNLSGNTLEIYYGRVDDLGMHLGSRGTEVLIYLPKDFQAEGYDFDIDASDVDIETALCAQNISMDIDASDVEGSGRLQADESLELNVDTGDVEFTKLLCNGDLSAACNAGSLTVSGECYGDIVMDVNLADVTCDLTGKKGVTCSYVLQGNLSDMEVNGQEYDGMDTDINIQGDAGAPLITLSCDAGSLEFKLK